MSTDTTKEVTAYQQQPIKLPRDYKLLYRRPHRNLKHCSVILVDRQTADNRYVVWIVNHEDGGRVFGQYSDTLVEAITDYNGRD